MSEENTVPSDPSDNHIYHSIFIFHDTFDFLYRSLCFYRDLLKRAIDAVNLDADLKALLGTEAQRSSPASKELQKVQNAIAWWDKLLAQAGEAQVDYNIGSFSHEGIRFLKSVGCLYLRHLRSKRDQFSQRPGESKYVLESLDTELARFEEKMRTSGVFGKASTIPLLVEDVIESKVSQVGGNLSGHQVPGLPSKQAETKPLLLETIQIIDPTLRSRCLDLFNSFEQQSQHERFDTVIVEATRILEDRLRSSLGESSGTGDELANKAFGSTSPKLRLSAVASEQTAVLLFFKAIFGYLRNPSHHKLLGSLSPQKDDSDPCDHRLRDASARKRRTN